MEERTIANRRTNRCANGRTDGRLHLIDVLRGLLVLAMVAFHGCFDLVYLRGISLPWFSGLTLVVWRNTVAWLFLGIAGVMCSYSHSNILRGLRYAGVALAIYAVTALSKIITPISFGIIFCMAACTLLYGLCEKCHVDLYSWWACGLCLLLFICFQNISSGYIGIGAASIKLPEVLYESNVLSWLGLPGQNFSSSDYYPLLPHIFIYLAGSIAGKHGARSAWPNVFYTFRFAPLEFVGRHALAIYLIHQPVLMVLVSLL